MNKIKEIIIGTNNEGTYQEICNLLPNKVKKYSPKATTEGVVLVPSAFSNTLACVPSITATHEFVVPKSIPITLLIKLVSFCCYVGVFLYTTS